jgi:serine hydrolase
MPTRLLIPGLWNSGPNHWQSRWETLPGFRRVNQADWDNPRRDEWVAELDRAVVALDCHVTLVAHSLGCVTVSHWSKQYRDHASRIEGALLVAPCDVEASTFPAVTTGFSPMPLERLPFRSTLVCSTNDQWVSLERATAYASAWGSGLIVLNDAGHINGDSDLGMWPDGMEMLLKLEQQAAASPRPA